ncbi:hypothetical protein BGX27_000654 [Mortierella sp. AM989]|nr:hypothetical protein BGX27_000654 [Mortierella sp. AM989]
MPECPNLHSLTISTVMSRSSGYFRVSHDLDSLLSCNRSIVHLTIENTCVDWGVLFKYKNITCLNIKNCTTDSKSSASDFWKLCSNQLESLAMNYVDIPGLLEMASENEDFFENMKTITISCMVGLETFVQLEIVRRCVNLDTLYLGVIPHDTVNETTVSDLVNLVTSNAWPNLQRLSFNGPEILEKDVVSILQTLKHCCQWDLPCSTFRPQSFSELRKHFATLVDLNVESYTDLSSELIQEILCSCPRLQAFQGSQIEAKDIVNGQPWVCSSLQSLIVFINANPPQMVSVASVANASEFELTFGNGKETDKVLNARANEIQMVLFERLSGLRKLSVLKIGDKNAGSGSFSLGLILRRDRGLEMLGKLVLMEHLHFPGTIQAMEMDDVEWMLSRWIRLRSLVGMYCHHSQSRSDMLQRRLGFGGINVERS